MKKLKMARGVTLTFEEGCNKYLENCRQRNLREGTINHYRQSYIYFYKFFDPKMPNKLKQCMRIYSIFLVKTTFYVEMMGLIGAGNNPMVGMTAPVAVAIEESNK